MQITNNHFNTMPEQVQENKDNIKLILAGIKELYSTSETLTEQSETIAQSLTNVPRGTKKGFLIDAEANLFNILSVVENVVYIKYMTNVKGVQGEQGVKGDKGEKGDKGDKGDAGSGFANITDINLVVGEPNVIYDTEDGITITSQGELVTEDAQYTPTVEQNIPLIAGNGLTMDATEDGQHVDIHLSAETQTTLARSLKTPLATPTTTKIVAVDNTNSQELLGIGSGLEKINGNVQVEQSVLNDVENNKEQIDLLQGDMAGKTNVTINNVHQDYINFSSDPQSQLNNKANKDLSNVTYPQVVADSTLKTGAGDRVIERMVSSDGLSWYEKYESGFIRYGGRTNPFSSVTTSGTSTTKTIVGIAFNKVLGSSSSVWEGNSRSKVFTNCGIGNNSYELYISACTVSGTATDITVNYEIWGY